MRYGYRYRAKENKQKINRMWTTFDRKGLERALAVPEDVQPPQDRIASTNQHPISTGTKVEDIPRRVWGVM